MRRNTMVLICVFSLLSFIAPLRAEEGLNQPSKALAPLQVLFIGNSYTYVNDLPAALSEMSEIQESPRSIRTKMIATPGATLQLHWENGNAAKAIQDGKWDFVVLQEQSDRPITKPETMRTYVRKFDELIKRSGAKTVLFATWSKQGKPEMQRYLNDAYFGLANELKSQVAPVGPAWQLSLEKDPSIELYMKDGSHPSAMGTYLATCTFFQTILEAVDTCPSPTRGVMSSEWAAIAKTSVRSAIMQTR